MTQLLMYIGQFFTIWFVLFAGITGMLLLAMFIANKTSQEPHSSDSEINENRIAASQTILIILIATFVGAYVLLKFYIL